MNSGEVRNRGIELEATMRPVERPTFRWDVVANWSKNTNKVVSLANGVQRIVVGSYWGVSVTADSGQPYGNLVGTQWQRDSQGRIVVYSSGGLQGLPVPGNVVALGNYNADWVGGITNTFIYNNRLQPCRMAASSTGAIPTNCTNSWGNVLDLGYDFHLGSGNILMEPNDQYLCIVPDSRARSNDSQMYLPFEGDITLSIILSKAFLLVEDSKIKDSTINRQICSR